MSSTWFTKFQRHG